MTREPGHITFGATAGGAMLVTAAAVALILYATLTLLELIRPSLVTQDLLRLVY